MIRGCHQCGRGLIHNGMFCNTRCSEPFWKAQADASPRRTAHSRRMVEVMRRKRERTEAKKAG